MKSFKSELLKPSTHSQHEQMCFYFQTLTQSTKCTCWQVFNCSLYTSCIFTFEVTHDTLFGCFCFCYLMLWILLLMLFLPPLLLVMTKHIDRIMQSMLIEPPNKIIWFIRYRHVTLKTHTKWILPIVVLCVSWCTLGICVFFGRAILFWCLQTGPYL